jgi:hypothetical protein
MSMEDQYESNLRGDVGVFIGAVVGVGALQLPVPPLVQSIAAVLVTELLSTSMTFFLWLRYPTLFGDAGDGFFSVSIQPGAKTSDSRPCNVSSVSVRVNVDHYPWEERERRVVTADLWLVEHLSSGKENSQPLSIRGLPNRAIPFYFDSIVNGNGSLDIFGRVVARVGNGAMEFAVQTRSRWGDSYGKVLNSSISLKPEEIVEIQLPKLGADAGPFGNRVFSIRVRGRQLR